MSNESDLVNESGRLVILSGHSFHGEGTFFCAVVVRIRESRSESELTERLF
jgi:hypothetical protein